MSPEAKIWIGGGAGAAFLLWLLSRQSQTGGTVFGDTDALARMILAETDLALGTDEMAQIVWIAFNRAQRRGTSIASVVIPPGTPVWNEGALYAKRFAAASSNPKWMAAQQFVQDVLAGRVAPNRGYSAFVHPAGMPTQPCASNRIQMNTSAGVRCMPAWIAQGTQIGHALFA